MSELSYITEPLRRFAVAIDQLREDPRNARKHNARNIDAVRKSLAKFGQQKPIVIGAEGFVIAGNGTLRAAKLLNWTHVAAIRSDLRGADATAFGLADNRTAELAEWDFGTIGELIGELNALDFDLGALGWSGAELEPLSAPLPDFAVPATPAPPSPVHRAAMPPDAVSASPPRDPDADTDAGDDAEAETPTPLRQHERVVEDEPDNKPAVADEPVDAGRAPSIIAKVSIPPRTWLTMRPELTKALTAVCAQYGASVTWPD